MTTTSTIITTTPTTISHLYTHIHSPKTKQSKPTTPKTPATPPPSTIHHLTDTNLTLNPNHEQRTPSAKYTDLQPPPNQPTTRTRPATRPDAHPSTARHRLAPHALNTNTTTNAGQPSRYPRTQAPCSKSPGAALQQPRTASPPPTRGRRTTGTQIHLT